MRNYQQHVVNNSINEQHSTVNYQQQEVFNNGVGEQHNTARIQLMIFSHVWILPSFVKCNSVITWSKKWQELTIY